jgi:hypothetical protein
MAEQFAAADVHAIDMGEGAAVYKELLKTHDLFVARGIVTSRSLPAAARRVSINSAQRAGEALFRHQRLYQATRSVRRAVVR